MRRVHPICGTVELYVVILSICLFVYFSFGFVVDFFVPFADVFVITIFTLLDENKRLMSELKWIAFGQA